MHSKEKLLRLQVKHQWSILQTHWVAADSVVDSVAGGEGRLTPVQKDGGGTVGLGVHVVWRRRRRHESIPHGWVITESGIILLKQFWDWHYGSLRNSLFPLIPELTDTSRGADSLVSLVAISNRVVSQKLDVVLLPGVYIERKKKKKYMKKAKPIKV